MRLGHIEDARDHIRMAENTLREAEHKRDEAQAARVRAPDILFSKVTLLFLDRSRHLYIGLGRTERLGWTERSYKLCRSAHHWHKHKLM
jgi:hypothetical protein